MFSQLEKMRELIADDEKLEFSTFRCAPESMCTYDLGYVDIHYRSSEMYEGCFIFSANTTDDSSWVAIGKPKNPTQAYQDIKLYFSNDRVNFDPVIGGTLHNLLMYHNFYENN
jgi:hypothetical protein